MTMQLKSKKVRRYTLPHRLADVVRLISVLSQHEYDFKTEKGLYESLRGKPLSVPNHTWEEVVQFHPEFFRTNHKDSHFALVIRSYFPASLQNSKGELKLRQALSITETQKLIDFAVTLYDKEVEQFKENGLWFPIIVACISLLGPIYTGMITIHYNNSSNKEIIALRDSVRNTNYKIDKLLKIKTASSATPKQ